MTVVTLYGFEIQFGIINILDILTFKPVAALD